MGHHHDSQDDSRDDIAGDHLDEADVAGVRRAWHADDGQRAGLRCDDGQPNPPPGNIFAPEKIIASVFLVFAKPETEQDDADEVKCDDQPIG